MTILNAAFFQTFSRAQRMNLTALGQRRHHVRDNDHAIMIPICPKCDAPLFILHFNGIDVDFCDRCRGLWLDAGELEALLTRTGARADDPLLHFQQQPGTQPTGRSHLCPRCDEPLREITVASHAGQPLTLDRCPRGHGLWFDADELTQLLTMFPAEVGAHKTIDHLNELFGMTTKH
jgi:Zn-finger nucleic acid-binding protein